MEQERQEKEKEPGLLASSVAQWGQIGGFEEKIRILNAMLGKMEAFKRHHGLLATAVGRQRTRRQRSWLVSSAFTWHLSKRLQNALHLAANSHSFSLHPHPQAKNQLLTSDPCSLELRTAGRASCRQEFELLRNDLHFEEGQAEARRVEEMRTGHAASYVPL